MAKEILRDYLLGVSEPKRGKSDPALFDHCAKPAPAHRLLEQPIVPERHHKPWRKRFVDLRTGAIVSRIRGGKHFQLVYPPWKSDHLLRIRGKLLLAHHEWVAYPRGWSAAAAGHPPYEIRTVVDLARQGADVSGCNIFGAADYAALVAARSTRARDEAERPTSTPTIVRLDDYRERNAALRGMVEAVDKGLMPGHAPARQWTAKDAESIRLLHLALAKRNINFDEHKGRAAKIRPVTSERRNESGEYGPETRMGPDGRVLFYGNQPWLPGRHDDMRLDDRRQTRNVKFKDGRTRRVEIQSPAAGPAKPGPKPKHGVAMDAWLRKRKERCEKRGIPFVPAHHKRGVPFDYPKPEVQRELKYLTSPPLTGEPDVPSTTQTSREQIQCDGCELAESRNARPGRTGP